MLTIIIFYNKVTFILTEKAKMADQKGLLKRPDYTEELVGFAIEAFLAVASFPRYRFSIEPFSKLKERQYGADGCLTDKIQHFKPFYMQFKRPYAYPQRSRSHVIKDRARLELTTSPISLFFELRKKKPNHTEYQHNILFKLREDLKSRNEGDAAYVCPLFLDRKHTDYASIYLRWSNWNC
jgi:hypothetical protein